LSIGITVVNQLVTTGIPDLNRGMAQCPLSLPFNLIACALGDEEWFAAALVAVAVKTLLDSEVENLAARDFRWLG